jgi:integrase
VKGYSLARHGTGWRVRIYGGRTPEGKTRQLSRVFGDGLNERDANRRAQAIAAELRAHVEEERERSGTVAELAAEWLALKERQGRSPVTLDGYRFISARVVERFGTLPVAALTARELDRWYGEMAAAGAGRSTIAHTHAVVRGMMRQAMKWGQVDYDVSARASPPTHPRREVAPPPLGLLAVAVRSAHPELRHMLAVAALTGVRNGDVCGLWWSDVEGDTLTVRRSVIEPRGDGWAYRPGGKTGRVRSFTIGPATLAVIDAQRAWVADQVGRIGGQIRPHAPMFPNLAVDVTGATPRRPTWLTAQWRQLRERHELHGARVHDLRHLNVTVMLGAGVPARAAADRVGHSRVSITTDTYGHGTAAGDDQAATVVDAVIGSALGLS